MCGAGNVPFSYLGNVLRVLLVIWLLDFYFFTAFNGFIWRFLGFRWEFRGLFNLEAQYYKMWGRQCSI